MAQNPPAEPENAPDENAEPARIGWVVAAFLLFWPLAVPALVQAVKAARTAAANRRDAARAASRRALGFAVAAICTGTVLLAGSAAAAVMAPAWLPADAAEYVPPALAEMAGIVPPDPERSGETEAGPASNAPGDTGGPAGTTDPFGYPTPGTSAGEDVAEWWATEGQEATEDPSRTKPVDLQLGDCLDTEAVDGVAVLYWIPVVPCDEPHHGEVFGVTRLDDSVGADGENGVPTQPQLWEAADAYCYPEFDEFVGETWAASELTYWPVAPSQESWEEGDRKVACVIESDDPVTGTLEDAGR